MKTKLVRIGNSRGIRLPKAVIEQAGLGEEVELDIGEGQIIIRTKRNPREGWEDALEAMAAAGDDQLLDGDLPPQTEWDLKEWQW